MLHYIIMIVVYDLSSIFLINFPMFRYKKINGGVLHRNNAVSVIKNDHRLLPTLYFKYHAPFQDTASSRARCLFTSTTLLSNAVAVYRKKSLCVCIFCRSARPLPCDVVAEPQTSTLQVETSNQIYAF